MLIKTRLLPPQQKPGPGSEIDWGHPLSRGLVGCWLFNEGAGLRVRDMVAGEFGAVQPGASVASNRLSLDGIAGYVACGTKVYPWLSGAFSVDARFQLGVPTSDQAPLLSITASDHGIFPAYTAQRRNLLYLGAGNYRYWSQSPINLLDGKTHLGTWVCAGPLQADIAESVMYADGQRQDVFSTQQTTPRASITKLWIGRYNIYYFPGVIEHLRIYARALTPDEVRWLHAEPYAMIRPAGPMRRYFTVTALDQVFRLREQPQRFRLKELGPRFRFREKRP